MRHATEQDLPAIVDIYNASIPSRRATADLDPASVESKQEWFHRHSPNHYPLLVHESNGRITAWVGFQSFYDRPAYQYTAEISIYIAAEQQGRGLGGQLLEEALDTVRKIGLKTILAYVFSHNHGSIRLFQRVGFETWGEMPDVTEMDEKEYSVTILGKRINP